MNTVAQLVSLVSLAVYPWHREHVECPDSYHSEHPHRVSGLPSVSNYHPASLAAPHLWTVWQEVCLPGVLLPHGSCRRMKRSAWSMRAPRVCYLHQSMGATRADSSSVPLAQTKRPVCVCVCVFVCVCDSSSVPVAQTERPVLGSANATELSKAIRGNRYCLGFLCVCVCV